MKVRIWRGIGTWNLKAFFSVSVGLHLLFLGVATLLLPDFKIDRIPPLNIEISLLPIVTQEKAASIPLPSPRVRTPTKREGKKVESPPPIRPETKIPSVKTPVVEEAIPEMKRREEEKVRREPAVPAKTVSLDPEPVLTRLSTLSLALEAGIKEHLPTNRQALQDDPLPSADKLSNAQPLGGEAKRLTSREDERLEAGELTLPTLSSSGEQRKEAKYPSLSDVEIVFTQPRYAENPKPHYPWEARKKGYQGEVVLKVEVLSNGQVGQIEVKRSSGHEILDCSALDAVKKWRFIPATKGESAVRSWVNIPIKFQLQ